MFPSLALVILSTFSCFKGFFKVGDVIAKSAQNRYLKVIQWQLKGVL